MQTAEDLPDSGRLLAPWWHLALVVVVILGVSVLGFSRRSHGGLAEHHVREYAVTIAWEWALLAVTLGGVWLHWRSSIIFGAAHLYEGVSGVVAITLFGIMFAWLALRRRSLRAGMLAHAWHDAVSGIALYLLTRAHAL